MSALESSDVGTRVAREAQLGCHQWHSHRSGDQHLEMDARPKNALEAMKLERDRRRQDVVREVAPERAPHGGADVEHVRTTVMRTSVLEAFELDCERRRAADERLEELRRRAHRQVEIKSVTCPVLDKAIALFEGRPTGDEDRR